VGWKKQVQTLCPPHMKKTWSRKDKLTLWGSIATPIIIAVFSLFSSDVRRAVHLEKPTPTQTVVQEKAQSTPFQQPMADVPKPTTHTDQQTKGTRHNITKNSVAGTSNSQVNQASTGTNSPNVSAPNGMAIVGNEGTIINPVVNNFAPPNRRLSDEQRNVLVSCLQTKPGKFMVEAMSTNNETYRYAQDWSEVLSSAGWKNESRLPVRVVLTGPWPGVHVSVLGTWDEATQHATLLDDSGKKAFECFAAAHIAGQFVPNNKMPTDMIQVDVGEHP
jgi:hypothetical protein